MPHEEGHISQYIFETTGLPYDGHVIDVGGNLFSTSGNTLEGDSQQVILNSEYSNVSVEQQQEDVITTFVVGDGSRFGRLRFFRDRNRANTEIANGTPLHHHTIPAVGDNNFMTQHNMDGAVSVYSQNQVNFVVTNLTTTNTSAVRGGVQVGGNNTPRSGENNTPRSGGNNTPRSGGGMGGY